MKITQRKGLEKLQRSTKSLFTFPGKPCNHIHADGCVRHPGTCLSDRVRKIRRAVRTVHGFQHARIPTLHGKVKMVTQMFSPGEKVDQIILEFVRLDGADPDPLDPLDLPYPLEKAREIAARVAVGADVDAGDDHLTVPAPGEVVCLAQAIVEGATPGASARIRDDAEGTEEIAPILDLEVGPGLAEEPGLGEGERPPLDAPVDSLPSEALVCVWRLALYQRPSSAKGFRNTVSLP